MINRFCQLSAICCALIGGQGRCDEIRVVATGDSLTNGYGAARLQSALDVLGLDAAVTTVASSGGTASRYIGRTLDPHTNSFRQMDEEVLAADPDVILFMLGTNDAFSNSFVTYSTHISGVFDRFQSAVNSRGVAPSVVVMKPIPILKDVAINGRLEGQFLPWLEDQAATRGWNELNLNQLIREQPDWQEFYSDGIHLWANGAAGYNWMAAQAANAVKASVNLVSPDAGDFDGDGLITVADIDALTVEHVKPAPRLIFDVNRDGRVTSVDREVWVHDIRRTVFGDANLDGTFDSGDLVQVFQHGEYQDLLPANSTWGSGDWNGDFEFTSADLVLALQDGDLSSATAVATSIPEPASALLAVWSMTVLPAIRKRVRRASKHCDIRTVRCRRSR